MVCACLSWRHSRDGPGSARAIVPDGLVAEATGQRITGGAPPQGIGYGYFWWVGSSGGFSAFRVFGQSVTLFPADRLGRVEGPLAGARTSKSAQDPISDEPASADRVAFR
jgi:hypothetical protein